MDSLSFREDRLADDESRSARRAERQTIVFRGTLDKSLISRAFDLTDVRTARDD